MREEERGNGRKEEEGRENRRVNNGRKMEEWRKEEGDRESEHNHIHHTLAV